MFIAENPSSYGGGDTYALSYIVNYMVNEAPGSSKLGSAQNTAP